MFNYGDLATVTISSWERARLSNKYFKEQKKTVLESIWNLKCSLWNEFLKQFVSTLNLIYDALKLLDSCCTPITLITRHLVFVTEKKNTRMLNRKLLWRLSNYVWLLSVRTGTKQICTNNFCRQRWYISLSGN